MLVLTGRAGENIVIDDRIRITIVEIRGDNILVRVDAPPGISVGRAEARARPASIELVNYQFELPVETPQ